MNAKLNGQELPNTPAPKTAYGYTPHGWACHNGNVVTCCECGNPITRQDLEAQALDVEDLAAFDTITCQNC